MLIYTTYPALDACCPAHGPGPGPGAHSHTHTRPWPGPGRAQTSVSGWDWRGDWDSVSESRLHACASMEACESNYYDTNVSNNCSYRHL